MVKKRLFILAAVIALILPMLAPAPVDAQYCNCEKCKFRLFIGWFCFFPQADQIGYCTCLEIEASCYEGGDSCIIVYG